MDKTGRFEYTEKNNIGERLTKTRSDRKSSTPYAGSEQVKTRDAIPTLNKASDQDSQIVNSQQRTSVRTKMNPSRASALSDVACAVKTVASLATQNETIINTDMPFDGTDSASLLVRTKKRQKEKADKCRKRFKSESREIRRLSETADVLAEIINSGQVSMATRVFLNKDFEIEVIGKLLETDKCSRSDVQNILNSCVEMLMSEMKKKVKSVWLGFRQMYPNVPIFVLISYDNGIKLSEKDIPNSFRSFEFVFRHEFEVSEEAREITKYEENKQTQMCERQRREVKITLSKNIDQLLKCHRNIEMVGVSSIRSIKYGHRNARLITGYCIVVYVHVKGIIPYGEKEFPRRIEHFPVDVREGKFVPYSNVPGAREYHQCLLMGCQIVRCKGSSGTLGGFLDLQDGRVGILTCAHVALTEEERNTYLDSSSDEQLRQHISIPWNTPRMGQPDEYHEFGTVLKFALKPGGPSEVGVDAAVVTITERAREPVCGAFPKNQCSASGFTADSPMEFPSGHCTKIEDRMEGCEVVKFGATTDITRGLIAHNCLHARRSHVTDMAFKEFMYNQMEITPLHGFHRFAQKGDSGAIVFMAKRGNRNKLVAVGMVVGGTTSDTAVVTPILDILKALDLKYLCFKTFDPCPRPRQLLSLEDLKKGQEKQSKQITDQEKRFQRQINRLEKEIKKGVARTHEMIARLSRQIQARR
ncbi:hypothetical protein CHS0354_026066 [Potamilus streckersoni]|nr:hypothetical protein CHS0354_026066 [Potamilus streckersoni]